MRCFIILLFAASLFLSTAGCQKSETSSKIAAASIGGSSKNPAKGLWSKAVQTANARAAAEAADLDGDGDEDIVLVGKFAATTTDITVLTNDGTGKYAAKIIHQFPSVTSQNADDVCILALTDSDRDGDVDILFGDVGVEGSPLQLRLLKNDGTGSFSF